MLKRFIARYGAPNLIISDNGTNFISDDTQTFLASNNINWKQNLPAAPWQGGFFERMIISAKRCLKKVIFKSCVTFSQLLTFLHEIEAVINNRPLTFVYSSEFTDCPLTPNILIYGRNLYASSIGKTDVNVLTGDNIEYNYFVCAIISRSFLVQMAQGILNGNA